MGFYYWSCCYACHLAYLIMFESDGRFVGIVPNGEDSILESDGTMYQAGGYRFENDDIPF